ncbi:hypothetical protein K6025_01975 [Ehrlichia sp. JZT12]
MYTPQIIAQIISVITLLLILAIALTVRIISYPQHSINNEQVTFSRILNISKQEIQHTILADTTTEKLNNRAMTGYTSLGDITRMEYTINDVKIDKNKAPKPITSFEKILLSETATEEETETITNDIVDLMHKHKEALTASYKIDEETCCKLLSNRIGMAAYFEDFFKKHGKITPNTTMIHELVTNCNQAGFLSSVFFTLTEICNSQHSEVSILPANNISTSLTAISEDKIICNTTADTTIWEPNADQKYDVKYKIGFTISSEDPKLFTDTSYENIEMELIVPQQMIHHITKLNPTKRTQDNKDNTILIDKKITPDNQISLTYSIPNLKVPSIINQSNLNHISGHIDESKIKGYITHQRQL